MLGQKRLALDTKFFDSNVLITTHLMDGPFFIERFDIVPEVYLLSIMSKDINDVNLWRSKDRKSRIDFTSDLPSISGYRLSTVLYHNVDSLYQNVGGKSIVDFTNDSTRFCCCCGYLSILDVVYARVRFSTYEDKHCPANVSALIKCLEIVTV